METATETSYPLEIPPLLDTSTPLTTSTALTQDANLRLPGNSYQLPDWGNKPSPWKRLAISAACVTLGLGAIAVGIASFTYRLNHLTVDSGIVNGRTVRLRAPVDGKIRDFYARPGASVRAGQVLAQLEPFVQAGANLTQLQQEAQSKAVELIAARQSLDLLNRQLQQLESHNQVMQTANVAIAAEDVDRYQAEIDAARAEEKAARANYERHQQLLAAGAVSRQQVEQLRAVWESAQAMVQQKKAQTASAQVSLKALSEGAPIGSEADLQEQHRNLMRKIQTQTALISTLESQAENSQEQVAQAQVAISDLKQLQISAPFSGVVYSTEYDAGEQVSRPATLLSLLDCNQLWVETLVRADQADQIDIQKPVRIRLSSESETLVGNVETIKAISSSELSKLRTQALIPAVSTKLTKQPLARVKVSIPPTDQQTQAYQFCGVGQSAQLTFGMQLFAVR
ncbi:MAG: HlyD family efflux transporter periplasmic adaptor subunit [Cyanothece sp. SIO1E1]|nr:HlyD family efflux transporter periplasmic adaptor subunit [Cyanothece sp. SIO1E1]